MHEPSQEAGEPAVTGRRGPTGDSGTDGTDGVDGHDGVDGLRGQMGLVGAPAPRRSPVVTVLLLVAVLAGLGIVAEALWLVVDSARDENRLVADRDAERDENRALREEVAGLREENELERASDACFDAFTADIAIAGQATRALSTQMEAGIIYGLFTFVPDPPPEALLDADALLQLADDADAAARLDKAATDARNAWVAAGRPMPCPLDVPTAAGLGTRYMFSGRWDE